MQALEALVEQNAISNCHRQQNGNGTLYEQAKGKPNIIVFQCFVDRLEGRHGDLGRIERARDPHRYVVADMAHNGFGELYIAAA